MAKKLQWLEAMRALAACWVLLLHAKLSVTHFVGPMGAGSVLAGNGYLGVDFFFVLSGFIIAFSSNRLLERERGFGDYARARLIRIYIPYLPIGIGMLLLYTLFPSLSESDRSPGLLTSLTLLPSTSAPALSVAWTLIHELLFYAIFSLFFFSRRLLCVVLTGWTVWIVIQAWFGLPLGREGWGYVLSPLNLCFLLGVAVYYLTRKGVGTWAAIAGALLGIFTLVMEAGQPEPTRWLVAIGFAGFVVCALSRWAQRWSPGRWMLFVGAASYSIYLVHNPLLSVAIRVLKRFIPGVTPLPAFLLIAIPALLGGLAYYYFYERYGLALARKVFSGSAGPVVSSRATVVMKSEASTR